MTMFTIDSDNNITAFAELPAGADPSFSSEKEFAKLTANWPASRLVEVWNGFAGVVPFDDLKPVQKFKDRKTAVARIWKAVQRLEPAVAPQLAQEAPKPARTAKSPAKGKRRATGQTDGQGARDGSKKAAVLELLGRKQGATLAEIMTATGWQAHSVRGFISGTLGKKMGLTVESVRGEDKERTYRINT